MSAQCSKTFSGSVIDDNCFDNASPLPSGNVGSAYSEQLTASVLTAPMTFIVLNGTLPDGLTLDADTGEIYGVPTLESSYSFQAKVMDSNGLYCLKNFTIDISAEPPPTQFCEWWDEIVWTTGSDPGTPVGTTTLIPDPMPVGTSSFSMNVQQPEDIGASAPTSLQVIGDRNYTGPALQLKIKLVVTACSGIANMGDGIHVEFKRDGVLRLDEQIQAAGTYEYFVDVDEELVDALYKLQITAETDSTFEPGDIQCSVLLGANANVETAMEHMIRASAGGNHIQYQIQTALGPSSFTSSATISLVSSEPLDLNLDGFFNGEVFASAPTMTIDGVPVSFIFSGGAWVSGPTLISLDGCVEKIVEFSANYVWAAGPYGGRLNFDNA